MALANEPFIIDGLELSNWDRDFLLDLHKGGVTCVHACCGLWENARETLSKIGEWKRFFDENSDLVMQVHTGGDILKAKTSGRIGVVLGTQNTSLIEDELSLVPVFNQLGIKIMQLTYNNQNLVGSSCYEERDSGLTRFGKNVIDAMNKEGVIIDLSHCGTQTTLDAINYSSRPVAITHANPDWIYPSGRNKSKKVLSALRDNGGILGLCAYPHLINGEETTLSEFTDLIKQTVDFMGVDKVALGTDLTLNMSEDFLHWMRMGRWTHEINYGAGSASQPSWPSWPSWFQTPSDFPNIREGLYETGMAEKDVNAIMGNNWLQFFTAGFEANKGG
ncbi:membrane dipeptidase [Alkalicoccus halolimnae]|uniref:Membrane dipeptidase n=1 Tax=Alkalicoccus halolimnae TaxID=1667239 RepID=A0A5C7F6X6_9BACI|nr:membrane dipeptidase [Alkalicoccus halolimnae]TXF85330.1 membrane dipeptidase [Alkalicoccus halolimnae]